MTYISNKQFGLEVAKGNVSKHSIVIKFGRNFDIDTAADEDIWVVGGTNVEPTAARIHSIVSTSANDTSAGTGTRTVFIDGLNSSYNVQTETVTMNGLVPVLTANSYTFINRMYSLTGGSNLSNVGDITATAAVDLTAQAQISAGLGQTQKAIYMVPTGYKAYLVGIECGMQQTTANNYIDMYLKIKDFGTNSWRIRNIVHLTNSGTSYFDEQFDYPLQISAKSIIKWTAGNASANNNDVSAKFKLVLVQD